jgi:copper binding plastocyanin/azurin family protein
VIDAAPPPLPVGVGLREWSVAVYRTHARPGRLKLNLTNFGEDAHDLQVFGPAGYRSARSPEVAPAGGRETLRVTLQRTGAYRLLCMKPGHAGLGMRATLRVSRRPAPRRAR